MSNEQKIKPKKCPFGHKWHTDVDKHPDCETCDKWENCINNRIKD